VALRDRLRRPRPGRISILPVGMLDITI